MDLFTYFPKIEKEPIESLDQCRVIVNNINGICKNKKGTWKAFYRGDRKEAKLITKYAEHNKGYRNEHADYVKWNKDYGHFGYDDFAGITEMQHYSDCGTRLLDFSLDLFVALRFACGRKDDPPKREAKIVIDICPYVKEASIKASEAILKLIKSPIVDESSFSPEELEMIKKDYFFIPDVDLPRLKRQQGAFLLFGNLTDAELLSGNPTFHSEKVMHELNSNIGRGNGYPGYIGVLEIDSRYIDRIREELEHIPEYKMDYLLESK